MKKVGVLSLFIILLVGVVYAIPQAYWNTPVAAPGDNVKALVDLQSYADNINFKVFEVGGNPASVSPSSFAIKNKEMHDDSIKLFLPLNKQTEFGESDSFAYDFSGNNNNGIISGATFTSGKYGGAYSFNGAGSYIIVSDNEDLNPELENYTVELWFKTNISGGNLIKKQEGAFNPGYEIVSASFGSGFVIGLCQIKGTCTSFLADPKRNINDNQWHQFDMVLQRSPEKWTYNLYLDGSSFLTSYIANQGGPTTAIANNASLIMGNASGNYGEFKGSMDNIIIYKRDLSNDEVMAHYQGKVEGLVAEANWIVENRVSQYYFNATVNGTQIKSGLLEINSNCVDNDRDGYYAISPLCTQGTDCNDNNANVHPGLKEICNGIDDNCIDGIDEENSQGCIFYYKDSDRDSYGILDKKCLCLPLAPYDASQLEDCNDNNINIHPGVIDYCGNGIDEDCSGTDSMCMLSNPKWDAISAMQGQKINLSVDSIFGKTVNFKVFEQDSNECGSNTDIQASVNPPKAIATLYSGNGGQISIENSMKFYLKLDRNSSVGESDSLAYDFSGNNNNGIISGATFTSGKYGGAYSFNGAGSYIIVSDNEDLNPELENYTVELWFKTNISGGNLIKKQEGAFNPGYEIVSASFGSGFVIGLCQIKGTCTSFLADPKRNINDNQWHQFDMVLQRSPEKWTYNLYLDGSSFLTSYIANQGGPTTAIANNASLIMGNASGNYGEFKGSMDNIIIYKRDLSNDEVMAHYQGKVIQARSNWTAEYKNEGTCNPPEYYFTAQIDGEPGQIIKSELLTVNPGIAPVCSNNITEQGEICDGTDLNGKSCVDFSGFDSGILSCLKDCSGFDLSKCVRSSNLVIITGNNFISIPGNLSNSNIDYILGENKSKVNAIFSYQNGWKIYFPSKFPSTLLNFEPGKGYIISANSNFIIKYSDKLIPTNEKIHLKQGWNLISTLSKDISVSSLFGAGTNIWNYDNAYNKLGNSTILYNSTAYWVYSTSIKDISPIS